MFEKFDTDTKHKSKIINEKVLKEKIEKEFTQLFRQMKQTIFNIVFPYSTFTDSRPNVWNPKINKRQYILADLIFAEK